MYFEIFLPLALGGLGGGIFYRKLQYYRQLENDMSYDGFELCDEDYDSCPTIMFDKNGNIYYMYE